MLFKRFLVVLGLLLFIVSCSKEEADQPVSGTPMETEGDVEKVEETMELVSAANIFPGLSVYEDIDGKHAGVLMAGEIVSFTGKTGKNKKDHNFYQIITDENETVWTWASYIFEKSRPGVVKPGVEAFIFSKSNENAVTSEKLEPMTIVAVDSEHKNDTFLKVSWLTEEKAIKHNLFVVSDSISYNSADIKVARILNKYKEVENKELKEELLSNARSITGVSSDFASYIDFLEQDEFSSEEIPDFADINEKYKDTITLKDGDEVTLNSEPANIEVLELDYNLLSYLVMDAGRNEGMSVVEFDISNFCSKDLKTIPAEVSVNINGSDYFLGVLGEVLIKSGEVFSFTIGIEDELGAFEGTNEEYILTLTFVNNYKIQGKLRVF